VRRHLYAPFLASDMIFIGLTFYDRWHREPIRMRTVLQLDNRKYFVDYHPGTESPRPTIFRLDP
jgi:hypothetical protein